MNKNKLVCPFYKKKRQRERQRNRKKENKPRTSFSFLFAIANQSFLLLLEPGGNEFKTVFSTVNTASQSGALSFVFIC